MAGHFSHYAFIGYACVYATCTLSASATVQVTYTQAHPLNNHEKIVYVLYNIDYNITIFPDSF